MTDPDTPPTVPSGSGVSDLVGTVLAGRYRIIKKLGDGGMGAVYLGEHVKFGRKDAIKVLHPSLATDPEAIARFNRGARNVSAIRHPNICTIYDCSDTAEGFQFLAMEFVPGETLKDIMDRERVLPVERALNITRQIADALQAAHDAGIIHRDLKPANVMILPGRDGADEVRVVDFDIAKGSLDEDNSEVTRIGYVVGTPEYMSPEQLTAERLDGRTDLYSLGLILFRMLTGNFPFRAETREDLFLGRLTQTPRRLDEAVPGAHFAPELQAILDRALQRSPTDRYPSAAAFGHEVSALLPSAGPVPVVPPAYGAESSGSVPATRVSESPMPPSAGARSSRTMLVAGSLLVLALLAAGAIWVVAGGRDEAADAPAQVATLSPAPAYTPPVEVRETQVPAQQPPSVPQSQPADPVPETPEPAPRNEPPPRTNRPVASQAAPVSRPPPPTPSSVAAPREDPGDILRRQLGRVASADPASAVLAATLDTAQAIWGQDVAARDKARAAYIVAQVWAARGDQDQCATWARRAVSLQGSNQGYQRLLATCTGEAS